MLLLDMTMPEHDLEPPKFARKALERLLSDWSALKSMIILGVKQADESVSYSVVVTRCSRATNDSF